MIFWYLSRLFTDYFLTPMLAYQAGQALLKFVRFFIYIHTLCMQVTKAVASMRKCAGSPEHSLLDNASSYLNGSYDFYYNHSSCFILTSQHLLTIMKTMAVSCIKTENKIGGPTETK